MQTNKNIWQLLPLSEIASVSSNSFVDGPFGSNLKSDEYTTEGVRLIQLQNIGDGEWIDDNKIFTSEMKYQELKRHAAFPGDIAIAKMADPIARACIIPPVSDRFLVVADCIKLTPDLKKYHPKFIVYAINNHSVRLQAELKSTGTTRNRINLSLLKTVNVEIPPLPEQRRIAETLDTIDEAIQKTEALISKLKAVKQGLLHDLLTRGLDKNGKLRDPKAHPEQFKASPLGRIPSRWEVVPLSKISRVRRGASPRPIDSSMWFAPEGKGWIRISDVTKANGRLKETEQYLSSAGVNKSVSVYPGQIIMSICATIGEPIILDMDACIHDGFVVFDQYDRFMYPEFLIHFLRFKQSYFKSQGQTGTQANLNTSIVKDCIIGLPILIEQKKIANTLDAHDVRIRTEEQYRDKLKLQKNGLMHDLLTGKVRVKA